MPGQERLVRGLRGHFNVKIFETRTFARLQARSRTRDPHEETRIMVQLVVEPIVFRGKSHEDSRRLTVLGDNNLFALAPASDCTLRPKTLATVRTQSQSERSDPLSPKR